MKASSSAICWLYRPRFSRRHCRITTKTLLHTNTADADAVETVNCKLWPCLNFTMFRWCAAIFLLTFFLLRHCTTFSLLNPWRVNYHYKPLNVEEGPSWCRQKSDSTRRRNIFCLLFFTVRTFLFCPQHKLFFVFVPLCKKLLSPFLKSV